MVWGVWFRVHPKARVEGVWGGIRLVGVHALSFMLQGPGCMYDSGSKALSSMMQGLRVELYDSGSRVYGVGCAVEGARG